MPAQRKWTANNSGADRAVITVTKQEALPIRLSLGLLAVVALAVQIVVLPRTAEGYAREYPEVAYLEPGLGDGFAR